MGHRNCLYLLFNNEVAQGRAENLSMAFHGDLHFMARAVNLCFKAFHLEMACGSHGRFGRFLPASHDDGKGYEAGDGGAEGNKGVGRHALSPFNSDG
jgi:hypothetical protein